MLLSRSSEANKNASTADVPPVGDKQNALCWQENPTTGNAKCVVDCVNVTTTNGSVFYPVVGTALDAGRRR